MTNKSFPNIVNCNPLECISSKMMRCNRIIANIFREHLKEFDITDSQLSILFFITKSGNVSQKEISVFLKMEKSTVNRNIQRLLKKNYIDKEKPGVISTTIKGKQILERIIPKWQKAMSEAENILGEIGMSSLDLVHTKLSNI